jgi:hypothetical protein
MSKISETLKNKKMNVLKISYWSSTILLCLFSAGGAMMYFVNYETIIGKFQVLGFPAFIVIPLAVSKLLAVTVILMRKWEWAMEWAYAGLTFVFCLAIAAHIHANDGEAGGAVMALVLAMISYSTSKYLFIKK